MKTCPKCQTEKPQDEFYKNRKTLDGLRCWCKACGKLDQQAWYFANTEKVNTASLARLKAKPEKARAANKAWRDANSEHLLSYQKRRRATDPVYAMVGRQRARLREALRNAGASKRGRALDLLGCTSQEFKAYLEDQFLPGMSWGNRSEWHIDHKRPLASFDLTDPAQARQAFHHTNCQPLWASDNLKKSDTWRLEQEAA